VQRRVLPNPDRGRIGQTLFCLLGVVQTPVGREIVLVDRNTARADGVAADMRYAAPLSPTVDVDSGGYEELADAMVVAITAGVSEKAGGATDCSDSQGRLRLLRASGLDGTPRSPPLKAGSRARRASRQRTRPRGFSGSSRRMRMSWVTWPVGGWSRWRVR
jgi:hypothetical protein